MSRKAGKFDAADAIITLGVLGLGGALIYFVVRKPSTATAIAPVVLPPSSGSTAASTWTQLPVGGTIPNGATFALVATAPSASSVAQAQTLSTYGATVSLPGSPPPPNWPIANDGGGTNALRILATNTNGAFGGTASAASNASGVTVWVQNQP